jgi:hypothetical protein
MASIYPGVKLSPENSERLDSYLKGKGKKVTRYSVVNDAVQRYLDRPNADEVDEELPPAAQALLGDLYSAEYAGKMTGFTPTQLRYLDLNRVIRPKRFGRFLYYDRLGLLQLKIFQRMKGVLNWKKVQKINGMQEILDGTFVPSAGDLIIVGDMRVVCCKNEPSAAHEAFLSLLGNGEKILASIPIEDLPKEHQEK